LSIIRKTGNVLLIVLGVFLILTGILSAKIRNPRFQTYLSEQFIGYLSKKLKADLSIGSVNFELFHHLVLHDVLIKDQKMDTLLLAKTIDISFGLLDLFQKKYVVKQVTLDQSRVYLHKFKETGDFNFQFIADAFSGDSTSSSSTASSTATSPAELDLDALVINQIHLVMLDEPNNTRLDFQIPKIDIDVKKLDLDKALIRLNEISFHNADLKVAKLVREIEPDDTLGLPDTAVVHINTKPLRLYVSKLRFVDSRFQFDDEL
jgi:translocation and assembly module TamB